MPTSSFEENGYVVIENVLTVEILKALQWECDRMQEAYTQKSMNVVDEVRKKPFKEAIQNGNRIVFWIF